jgi:hypothetical protein
VVREQCRLCRVLQAHVSPGSRESGVGLRYVEGEAKDTQLASECGERDSRLKTA